MDDELHDLLEGVAAEHAQRGDAEDLARRVRLRHRRKVGSAVVAAVLVATLGLGLTLSTLRFDQATPESTSSASITSSPVVSPGPAAKLQRTWSATIADTAMPSGVLVDGDVIVVPTDTGVVTYPIDCSNPCTPLWRADVGAQRMSETDVAAADGSVAIVNLGRALYVFDDRCATDGSTCAAAWSVAAEPNVYLSSPSIADGIVRVTTGLGDAPGQQVGVLAFRQDCSSPCSPAWTADMGTGTIYGLVTNLDGVGYQQAGARMYGFASDCRSDGGVCQPDLAIPTGGPPDQSPAAFGPVGDNHILVLDRKSTRLNSSHRL